MSGQKRESSMSVINQSEQEYFANMMSDPVELEELYNVLENINQKTVSIQETEGQYLYMFVPVLLKKVEDGQQILTMALLDSGNLLQFAAMSEKLHQALGGKLMPTTIRGKSANQQVLNILGISEKQ